MGVSKNNGTPKWMVYKGKPYEQMDDLGCFPPIFGNTQLWKNLFHKQVFQVLGDFQGYVGIEKFL